MSNLEIDLAGCRARQRRLLEVMHRQGVDLAIVTRIEHVQWLAGPRYGWVFEPAAALSADGRLTLAAPNKPPDAAAADEVVTYDAQWLSTLRNDQRQASSAALLRALAARPKPRRIGVEYSSFPPHLADGLGAQIVDLEPDLFRLRRRKEADELARLRKAIAGTAAMYARARHILEPGISELEMFNQLQAAAVDEFGEMLTGTGNDYACGEMGGPPRRRAAQAGELYILDLGPAFRGYFADNCRTLAVNRRPTDAQQQTWQHVVGVFDIVARTVRPGARCKALFETVAAYLAECRWGTFPHHLGHGIGLFPHEAPHLNPNWDDTFEEGDVFTVEPGIYGPELRAGIRLENNYLVTAAGVELLSDIPLEL